MKIKATIEISVLRFSSYMQNILNQYQILSCNYPSRRDGVILPTRFALQDNGYVFCNSCGVVQNL